MKKILIFLGIVGLIASIGLVFADSQTIGGDVPGFVSFDLLTTSVDYGSVTPGTDSSVQANEIRVNEANNIDFSLDIELTVDPEGLFENIFFDLGDNGLYEAEEQLDEILVFPITNPSGESIITLDSILRVPPGFPPVTDASGTITYSITVDVE